MAQVFRVLPLTDEIEKAELPPNELAVFLLLGEYVRHRACAPLLCLSMS